MKRILLISTGIIHPTILAQRRLRRIIGEVPGIELKRLKTVEAIASMDLAYFDGIVTYFHRQTISPAALTALDAYVKAGGGLLGIHAATASFKGEPDYFSIIGGKFTGHGSSREKIEAVQKSAAIFDEMKSFTVQDELYVHEMTQPVDVHFFTQKEGICHPLVWTRRHGQGRIAYVMFGHRASVFQCGEVGAIIRRAFSWIAGE